MKYFSLDYRSPPSGMGQIVDTEQPKKIGDKYNMILVDYGDSTQEDPHYVETKCFFSERAAQEGWAGPVMPQIIQYLRDQGVTHVYDAELSYDYSPTETPGGYFTLERWAEIMMKICGNTNKTES